MKVRACILSAFTSKGEGGNKAGVVLDAEGLTRDQMQQAAKILNFSETAFVIKESEVRFKVAFFTPVEEVDLCGHATIGTWTLLSLLNRVKKNGSYEQMTLAGNLAVRLDSGVAYMQQKGVELGETVDKRLIAEVLGIKEVDIVNTPQIVSTGLKDIIVVVRDKKILENIKPDLEALTKLSKDLDCIGLHAASIRKNSATIFADVRNFAPLVGINEESATGTSNGALLCYLKSKSVLMHKNTYLIRQGEFLNSRSDILGKFIDDQVWIGGQAKLIEEIEIDL